LLKTKVADRPAIKVPEVLAKLAIGATLLMVTIALYSVSSPSLSRIVPLTVRKPFSVVGQVVLLPELNAPYPEPSPQSKA